MSLLSTKLCEEGDGLIRFHLEEKPKHHRKKGVTPTPFVFVASEDELCPVALIKFYLMKTKVFRVDKDSEKLFLSGLKPHKSVGRDTLRRWLKLSLSSAGVDTTIFQGHSFRAASGSNANHAGLSMEEILRRGNWSRESTFKKFYLRNVALNK